MQSFNQRSRFRRLVKEKLDYDRQNAEAIGRGNDEGHNSSIEPPHGDNGHRPLSIDTRSSSSFQIEGNESPNPKDFETGEQSASDTPNQEPEQQDSGCSKAELQDAQADDLERLSTVRSNNTMQRTQSKRTGRANALTGIEVRTLTRELTRRRTRKSGRDDANEKSDERETVFVVGYDSEDDPMNPHNWSYLVRVRSTILIAMIGFIVGFASSIDSASLKQAAADFGVSEVTEVFASTGIFLIGFGFGALFAGPISETVGRNPVYIVTMLIFMIWIMASALAPNVGAQIVFRFLAGFFGSTPLTCAGGSISDLWDPMERVYMFPVFANAAFLGPIFGPVVGGFIGQSSLVSWRWCEWITLIISGAILVLLIILQPETYAPVLLKWKAEHLRKLTGDERYVAEVEIRADSFWTRILHALYRPFILAAREPIVLLFALYLTVIYIILFTFLDGYTYIFTETYGFSQGLTGLAFIGIAIGLTLASLWIPWIHRKAKKELAKVKERGGTRLAPEQRLYFAMFGAPAIPIALFWMGWTNYASISPWSALAASVLFGYGILCVFISSYQYIIDAYEMYAASALASLTLIRYVAAGGMTVVGIPFYENIGVHLTLTILGAISALMVPVPYLFFVYGPKIRSYSKFAASHNE